MNPALIESRGAGIVLGRRRGLLPPVVGLGQKHASGQRPWWMWPHLLSLDAPLVALVWQRWWAHAAGISLPLSREIILGLGVWLIYLTDRLVDGTIGDHQNDGAARHLFSAERRYLLLLLAVLVALTLATFTPLWLPVAEFRAGLGLLALAMGYFWLVHGRTGRGWAVCLPKEAAVGAMFGAGSVFFVVSHSPHVPAAMWIVVGLFAVVCFLNCALITRWEHHPRDLREPCSLLNAFPRFSSRLGTACWSIAAVALVVSAVGNLLYAIPVGASASLLAILDKYKSRMSTAASRVLADMVLLTPSVGLVWALANV